QGSRGGGAAAPLLDLWEQEGGRKVERDAVHGRQQAVAGCVGSHDGEAGNRCHGVGRLLRAAEDLARRAEQKERVSGGVVREVFSYQSTVLSFKNRRGLGERNSGQSVNGNQAESRRGRGAAIPPLREPACRNRMQEETGSLRSG